MNWAAEGPCRETIALKAVAICKSSKMKWHFKKVPNNSIKQRCYACCKILNVLKEFLQKIL